MSAATKSTKASTAASRRWLVRFGFALVLGLALGGGGGVLVVNKLEPGRPNSIDSLQAMLDSIARGRFAPVDSGAKPAATPTVPTAQPAPDTVAAAPQVVVPALVDLEEGAARNAILDAGLQVGEVKFQASAKPVGTVIGSTPASGTSLDRNSPVSLTLSDGRPPIDTPPLPLPSPRPPRSPLSRFDSRP